MSSNSMDGPPIVEVDKKIDIESEGSDFYDNAAKYWEGVDGTVNGMLGGFGKVSEIDIQQSDKLLKFLFKMEKGPSNSMALDCGAGIGRITKHLLVKHFNSVDLVEQDKKFLEKASENLKNCKQAGKLFCCGLQNFVPENAHYDVIWCQWVLGHLTDDHLVKFFQRCLVGLKPNGVLVVKENLTSGGDVEKDDEDSSVTRPEHLLKQLFDRAGMEIIRELNQQKMPQGLYPVKMFALRRRVIEEQ